MWCEGVWVRVWVWVWVWVWVGDEGSHRIRGVPPSVFLLLLSKQLPACLARTPALRLALQNGYPKWEMVAVVGAQALLCLFNMWFFVQSLLRRR